MENSGFSHEKETVKDGSFKKKDTSNRTIKRKVKRELASVKEAESNLSEAEGTLRGVREHLYSAWGAQGFCQYSVNITHYHQPPPCKM